MSPSPSRTALLGHFTDNLRGRRGFQRLALAFAYGALCALAYSPADAAPVLWIGFPALIFLLQGAENSRRAFAVGWSFAFGFFVFDIYWTAASMFVDIGHFWWAVPLAAFALPAFFGIYYGLAALVAHKIGLKGAAGAVNFALCWFLADYARGHCFTGFPWNIEGYIWADYLPVLQITSVIGIYGLTLVTLIAACLPAALAAAEGGSSRTMNRSLVMGSFAVFALFILWGGWRIAVAPHDTVPGIYLRLIQPSVEQKDKWLPEEREKHFGRLLELSSAPAEKPLTAIVWPETAAPFFLTEDTEHRQKAASVLPSGSTLITGVLRAERVAGTNTIHFFNSLIAFNRDARVSAVYDKAHLVPFGEYVPYRTILPIPPIAGMGMDFSHGPGAQTLRVPGIPAFSPLICYEAIFPGAVTDHADRPQFLLNVTNDGWYGRTAGPYQHFAIARVRAVEEGLPLVRDANTGISGIFDPYGRIAARLGLGKRGFIDGDLPQPLPAPTIFNRAGEAPLWLIFAVLFLLAPLRLLLAKRTGK